MNVIRRSRMGGKTTEIIRRALETPNAVVVVSNFAAVNMLKVDYGIRAITFQQFIDGNILVGKRDVTLFIDNADLLLQQMARTALIDTITLTTNSE